jgi:eukaryotic-like serine/threonine-protein kinase
MKLVMGELVGPYRLIGPHPGGGFRACGNGRRVRIEIADGLDWREQAVQLAHARELSSHLDHPGVARIVDRGMLPDRRPWIATELADGIPLSEILARRKLEPGEALELIRDLTSILIWVHGKDLVHGGLQPHAIIMRTGERAFPIQLGGWTELGPGDGAADIHALGVLAYRALTGKFPGLYPPELIAGVPGAISALIIRMLAPDPEDRPDAETVYAAVAALTGDRALSAPRFARPRWTPAPAELEPIAIELRDPINRRTD